jgi:asparagine synthase (glutamine-hydrolysing)
LSVLAPAPLRRRAVGRIAGASPSLGANALAADWDCCSLDGQPVGGLDDWRRILREGRLAEVSGAWALAWTDASGVLRLARDPIGERTVYYAAAGGRVAFGSTLGAVLDSGLVERRLHLPALATYLSWAYVPGEDTLVAGVRECLPGELVEFAASTVRRSRLWNPPPEPDESGADEAALTTRLRAALERAVRRRLPTGEPVAATLSGGIDSSLVVALARKLHDSPVAAYSVFFGERYPNELAWSALVARHCGVPHRVVEITPGAVLERLDDTIAQLSDPIGDPLTVPNALLFRAAADEAGVVLNGEGGDPCFGGPKNLPMVLASLFDGTLATADGAFAHEASYLRAHQKCYDDLAEMLAPDVRAALRDRPLERFVARDLADPRWRTMVQRLQWINLARKGAHHILHKVDEVSAPAGVLSRAPLFDRDVVECAFAIPPQLKLRGAVEKYLLKRAVADLLPREIVDRPKSGMLVPVEGWFRGPLAAAARERLLDGLAPRGLFDRAWLERLVAGKLGGLRPRHGVKIWLLVTLEAWLRRVLD